MTSRLAEKQRRRAEREGRERQLSGTIHNEGQADATLGQFFAVWCVPFSKHRLSPLPRRQRSHRAAVRQRQAVDAFGPLSLTDGQDIRITFGPKRTTQPAG